MWQPVGIFPIVSELTASSQCRRQRGKNIIYSKKNQQQPETSLRAHWGNKIDLISHLFCFLYFDALISGGSTDPGENSPSRISWFIDRASDSPDHSFQMHTTKSDPTTPTLSSLWLSYSCTICLPWLPHKPQLGEFLCPGACWRHSDLPVVSLLTLLACSLASIFPSLPLPPDGHGASPCGPILQFGPEMSPEAQAQAWPPGYGTTGRWWSL